MRGKMNTDEPAPKPPKECSRCGEHLAMEFIGSDKVAFGLGAFSPSRPSIDAYCCPQCGAVDSGR